MNKIVIGDSVRPQLTYFQYRNVRLLQAQPIYDNELLYKGSEAYASG